MKAFGAATAAALFLLPAVIRSHGAEGDIASASASLPDPVTAVFYVLAAMLILLSISVVLGGRLGEKGKKVLFSLVAAPVVFLTVYLAASTVYITLISESGGPVHWHADFEIWVCGEKVLLREPHGLDNKIGNAVLHHHNEGIVLNGTYRMHVEGVLTKLDEADLQHFFEATGNLLTEDSLGLLIMDGRWKIWTNGQECPGTGKDGELKVFVNGKQLENFTDYVIQPFSNVPPGDFIKFVFG